jgi:mercuric ion transport protein
MTKETDARGAIFSYLSLFTSVGTLMCCALPSLLVLFGLGATVASFLSAAPWLVNLSRHKPVVFTVSGVLIALGFVYTYRIAPRLKRTAEVCDPSLSSACSTSDRVNRALLWISGILWSVGAFTAFFLGPLLGSLDLMLASCIPRIMPLQSI